MTLTFEVEPSYISYALDDFQDECLPFTVEGKWHINTTDEEEKSAMEDRKISDSLEHITETEKEDLIMDNDMLVDSLESELEMQHLTPDQLEKMKQLADEADERFREVRKEEKKDGIAMHPFSEMMERRKEKWDTNYVKHDDYKEKLAQ